MGGWVGGWGKIENKDHLSPTETEIGAELGKKKQKKENKKVYKKYIQ